VNLRTSLDFVIAGIDPVIHVFGNIPAVMPVLNRLQERVANPWKIFRRLRQGSPVGINIWNASPVGINIWNAEFKVRSKFCQNHIGKYNDEANGVFEDQIFEDHNGSICIAAQTNTRR
jgi:hypothetical protein